MATPREFALDTNPEFMYEVLNAAKGDIEKAVEIYSKQITPFNAYSEIYKKNCEDNIRIYKPIKFVRYK